MKIKLILASIGVLFSFGCATKNQAPEINLGEANRKIVAAYYEAYNHQDVAGQIALMSPDFSHFTNSDETQTGTEAYKKYTESVNADVREEVHQINYIIGQDPAHIIAQSRAQGVYIGKIKSFPKANGQKYDLPVAEIFEVRDGHITKLSTYYNELAWETQVKKSTKK